MEDTAKRYCRELLDLLLAKGVNRIVLSPGSRNAPLLIGAACRPFKKYIITDERNAAFVALGMAMTSRTPVALVCTSGTALYNYAPAVAEAFYQNIPLVVISADRPLEWIDQDDSQTLIQPEALQKIVKGSYDIPVENPTNRNESWYVNRIVNEALNLAMDGRKGPVHINIRLDNPLCGLVEHHPAVPRTFSLERELNLPPHRYKALAEELRGKRIMVVAGFMAPDSRLNKEIAEFAKLPNVTLLCETLSNLHVDGNPYAIDTVFAAYRAVGDLSEDTLRPDVVISMGGALVSRMLKEFLRNNPPEEHWTLEGTSPSSDCFQSLTRHFEVPPHKFFKGIFRYLKKEADPASAESYSAYWQGARNLAEDYQSEFLENHRYWSELYAFSHILAQLPQNFNLFLSNGTSVRYGQLFTERIPHASYGCRGVSGIEGTSAAAAGVAIGYAGPTLLISGDMSFGYSPAILGLNDIPDNFKIVVISNHGGGIFRFIESTRTLEQREQFFCADPKVPVEGLARAYDWSFYRVSSCEEMKERFAKFIADPHKALLQIEVDEELSAGLLHAYLHGHQLHQQHQ